MKRRPFSLLAVILAAGLTLTLVPFAPAETASAIEPASVEPAATLKVAVARTSTAKNTVNYSGFPLNDDSTYDNRVNAVIEILEPYFDVTKIGDSELASVSSLERFDVVVLPRTLAMTGVQRQALRTYAARGGGVVGSFGVSRWDYTAGRSPHAYEPLITLWQFSDSWGVSRIWEWGEMSELYQVKFDNDPLMYSGYDIVGASSHPIVSWTKSDLGIGAIDMTVLQPDYNEKVFSIPGAKVTPLLTYRGASCDDGTDASGSMAAWASEYLFGRVVYFGFQLHDLIRSPEWGDKSTIAQSQRLLVNSVKWAGVDTGFSGSVKNPQLSSYAWFTRGKLYINETVANAGNLALRGYMRVYVYDPAGGLVFSGTAKGQPIPVAPGGSYTLKSWQPSIGTSHRAGTWRIKMTYDYYDHFRGGNVTTTRWLDMHSTGSSMSMGSHSAQTWPATSAKVYGTQLAGPTRYETGVALSKANYPNGLGDDGAVILATGANYPDALAAAPLAGKLDAPILLVPPEGLGGAVAGELTRLYSGASSARIFVMGGTGAVPEAVVDEAKAVLRGATNNSIGSGDVAVTRYAGSDRFATAARIAAAVGAPSDGTFADTAFIVSGENYPDALAVSPLAAKAGVPILPVQAGAVPTAIKSALDDLGIEHSVIVGGTGVVGPGVESWLEGGGHRKAGVAVNTADVDTRLAGPERYSTGLEVLDFSTGIGGLDERALYVATGANWPDALAVGPLAAAMGNPLLLVDGRDIGFSLAAADYLVSRCDADPSVTSVGGSGAVSNMVRSQIGAALAQ
jgi:putative cell wall-binding protein